MENLKTSHYPDYDVLKLIDEWDFHTKEIIGKRLGHFPKPSFFSDQEILIIRDLIQNITFDNREDIIDWVVSYLNETVINETGENQRKVGIPPIKIFIREGLSGIDHASRKQFGKGFHELDEGKQSTLLGALQLGQAEKIPEWSKVPQKELFKRLASEIISAYYSHPSVWSDIGYGGPAYPRGYVRTEFGLTDPWEARLDGK